MTWVIVLPFQLTGNPVMSIAVVCVATVALCVWNRVRILKQAKVDEQTAEQAA